MKHQRGASLITILIILMAVELISVAAAQHALMGERSAHNARDVDIAQQAAEAALHDAEMDMTDSQNTLTRTAVFDGKSSIPFIVGCGTSGTSWGLCASNSTGTPAWLSVDFTDTSNSARTVALGTFTGQSFGVGTGIRPAQLPRYLIEAVPDTSGTPGSSFVYRVTAMGFGPRIETQVVLQMVYRI
jgi:type IV pilus assembly protein PilX